MCANLSLTARVQSLRPKLFVVRSDRCAKRSGTRGRSRTDTRALSLSHTQVCPQSAGALLLTTCAPRRSGQDAARAKRLPDHRPLRSGTRVTTRGMHLHPVRAKTDEHRVPLVWLPAPVGPGRRLPRCFPARLPRSSPSTRISLILKPCSRVSIVNPAPMN